MKRLVIVVALLACFAAGSVRVQLVAQEKDVKPTAEKSAAAKDDLLPAVPREELRYDGKSFEDWQRVFQTELKTERRTEAVLAMTVFARNGYAADATATVLTVLDNYTSDDQGLPETQFLGAITGMLIASDPAVVTPRLLEILAKSESRQVQNAGLNVLSADKYRDQPIADALLAFGADNKNDSAIRFNALSTLLRVDSTNPKLLDAIRQQIGDAGPASDHMLVQWMEFAVLRFPSAAAVMDSASADGAITFREPLVPILVDGLRSKNDAVRTAALDKLRYIGPAMSAVLPDLLAMTSDADENLGRKAASVICNHVVKSPDDALASFETLADEQKVAYLKLLRAFAYGPRRNTVSPWLPFLLELSQDEQADAEIRKLAKELVPVFTPQELKSDGPGRTESTK